MTHHVPKSDGFAKRSMPLCAAASTSGSLDMRLPLLDAALVYVCVCVCMCVYVCVCVCMHVFMYVFMYVCTYLCMMYDIRCMMYDV
jgi:hypothetical protein